METKKFTPAEKTGSAGSVTEDMLIVQNENPELVTNDEEGLEQEDEFLGENDNQSDEEDSFDELNDAEEEESDNDEIEDDLTEEEIEENGDLGEDKV